LTNQPTAPLITLDFLKRRREKAPPRILLYGGPGVGKTTLAANMPNPIFMPIEDGLYNMTDVPAFPLVHSFGKLIEYIGWLVNEDHDFLTVVLDSLDWLEKIVWQETCDNNKWANIMQPGYGDGYAAALETWKFVVDGFEALRNRRNMTLVLLAHAASQNFKSPETPPYDRWKPKLHESSKGNGANPYIIEMCDFVLYYGRRVAVTNDTQGAEKVGKGHNRGVGGGQRVIWTEDRPFAMAKNRDGMPADINIPNDPTGKKAWEALASHISYFNQAA